MELKAGVVDTELTGMVIFWSGTFSFIQVKDVETVFFHRTNICTHSDMRMMLLYEVSLATMEVLEGKHKGWMVATNVNITKRGN